MDNASILDDILGRSTAYGSNGTGPVVVSENHNADDINWVGGVTDPGEMIGCGRYQILRRLDGESDRAYQDRLNKLLPTIPAADRAKIESAMKAAAKRRAGLDTSNGKVNVMVAGEEAWHGLGVHVAKAVSSADAIRLAGLDWTVDKQAMAFRGKDGQWVESADTFSLVRTDTFAKLSTVGGKYEPIQNAHAFEFLDAVVGKHNALYETAGSLHGGRKLWMQVRLPASAFDVAPGDHQEVFVTFMNSHGDGAANAYLSLKRSVCLNTLRLAARNKVKDRDISIRHTGSVKAKIADAQAALGLAVERCEEFKQDAEVLVRTRIAGANGYFNGVLDAVLDITEARMSLGAARLADQDILSGIIQGQEARHKAELAYQRAINERTSILEDILARHESATCGVGGIRGTAWAAMNAVTESCDHGKLGQPGRRIGSSEAQASRRFESILSGQIDQMKQTALAQALALAN